TIDRDPALNIREGEFRILLKGKRRRIDGHSRRHNRPERRQHRAVVLHLNAAQVCRDVDFLTENPEPEPPLNRSARGSGLRDAIDRWDRLPLGWSRETK